jgi:SecD/SecF fusion protein
MSVDANVLIYERVREEVLAGKGMRLAIADGFKNAMSAIIDGNVTTLLTGIILFVLGTGPVKGFATTLVIGICTSMFSAIFITRLVFELFLERNTKLAFSTRLTTGLFKNLKFNYMKHRNKFYGLSIAMVVIGVISLTVRGLDQGVDFTGGRNFIVKFEKPVDNIQIADLLEKPLLTRPTVITYGSANKVRITTKYGIESDNPEMSEQIQKLLYQGLKPEIGNDVSYEKFSTTNLQSVQLVGPTIADEIKRKSYMAIFVSLVMMFIYIGLRFRSWRFGLGAMASLAHDAFFVIAMFSLLYGLMPFSMEMDQTFIAAILTIIGYSVNDTVVIFDRIREHKRLHPKQPLKKIINDAINDTMSRTIITSLTVLITVFIIFIYTGESVMGFSFAMLLGLMSGIYSTVFIATALVFDTQPKAIKEQV